MRGALKKPSVNSAPRIEHATAGPDIQREFRAKKITRHTNVNRFGAPAHRPPVSSESKQIVHGEVINHRPAHRQAVETAASQSAAVALPSMVTSASHQKLERLLDQALTQADSHKQALKYQAARHFWQRPGFLGKKPLLKVAVVLLIVLGAGGFVAWHKMPVLSVKVAGVRSHTKASLPAYKPTGYSLAGPAYVEGGAVILKYNTSNNNRGFDLAQQQSNLTSSSLAQTVVSPGSPVQTSQVNGNTVYIYGPNNDASWVNNGILYTIKDHSKLSSDQIIKIVQGLN